MFGARLINCKKLFFVFLFVFLFLSLLSLLPQNTKFNKRTNNKATKIYKKTPLISADFDSPNVVSAGFVQSINSLWQITDDASESMALTVNNAVFNVYEMLRSAGKATTSMSGDALFILVTYSSLFIRYSANAFISLVKILGRISISVFKNIGTTFKTPAVHAFVRPADNTTLPVIDAESAIITYWQENEEYSLDSRKTSPKNKQLTAKNKVQWPINGQITTSFGVPHWPFQPTHTGIDISSGQKAGVNVIKPFMKGRVVETVISSVGLGNHVVVDHGEGLTSVYAHLYSINTEPGQEVKLDTVIGYEGSTGASTGTHLHFEIRQSGSPVNPETCFITLP